jgi:hypothetical protein
MPRRAVLCQPLCSTLDLLICERPRVAPQTGPQRWIDRGMKSLLCLDQSGCGQQTSDASRPKNLQPKRCPASIADLFGFFPVDFFPSLPQVSSTQPSGAHHQGFFLASPSDHPARRIRSSLTENTPHLRAPIHKSHLAAHHPVGDRRSLVLVWTLIAFRAQG